VTDSAGITFNIETSLSPVTTVDVNKDGKTIKIGISKFVKPSAADVAKAVTKKTQFSATGGAGNATTGSATIMPVTNTPSTLNTVLNTVPAKAILKIPGANNDLIITSKDPRYAARFNNVAINFVNTGQVTDRTRIKAKWNDTDPNNRTLTFDIPANATAQDLINAMNPANPNPDTDTTAARQFWKVDLYKVDEPANDGSGLITLNSATFKDGATTPGSNDQRAQVTLTIPGPNNDLKIQARNPGDDYNAAVSFVNSGRARNASDVLVTWNAAQKLLVFDIAAATRAVDIVNAMDSTKNPGVNKDAKRLFAVTLTANDSGRPIAEPETCRGSPSAGSWPAGAAPRCGRTSATSCPTPWCRTWTMSRPRRTAAEMRSPDPTCWSWGCAVEASTSWRARRPRRPRRLCLRSA
jgi:hypothetical protein